nr:MAG TPA: hypothetical protein [Caudoviricetes sp.]
MPAYARPPIRAHVGAVPVRLEEVEAGVRQGVTCLSEATGAIFTGFQGSFGRAMWVGI